MRVLLVEDEKTLSAAICKVLRRENFAVDPAYTGTEGLDCALSGIYDAVILDVMLPGLDGFSVLQRLRAAGVVESERQGNEVFYHVPSHAAAEVLASLFQETEESYVL